MKNIKGCQKECQCFKPEDVLGMGFCVVCGGCTVKSCHRQEHRPMIDKRDK